MRILLFIIGLLIFHFAYQYYLHKDDIEYDEYVCDHLLVKIYYGRAEQDTLSNFSEYETKSRIYLIIFSQKEGTNQELEMSKEWHDVGPAAVRALHGTDKIYQWQYLDNSGQEK